MEKIWLVVAVVSVITGLYQGYRIAFDTKDCYVFFIMAIVAFAMYSMRRKMRQNEEKNNL